jgi:hypothetical protein
VVLVHRLRLAGQRRLVRLQARGLHHAQVGADDIAALDQHDVARHRHLGDAARAAHPGAHLAELVKRFHRAHRAQLGHEAERGIDRDHGQDRDALGPVAHGKGHGRRGREQPHDQARQLAREDAPGGLGMHGRYRHGVGHDWSRA